MNCFSFIMHFVRVPVFGLLIRFCVVYDKNMKTKFLLTLGVFFVASCFNLPKGEGLNYSKNNVDNFDHSVVKPKEDIRLLSNSSSILQYQNNNLLKTPAQFEYPIAVNLTIPSVGYNVDNTGNTDASVGIQNALNYVNSLGGGTLYISSGEYLLNNQIIIPQRVTLVGEFNGVDSNDYGTVFLCNKTYTGVSVEDDAQILLSTNSGINGLTFYYPNQSVDNVVEYGFTIYSTKNDATNLSNLFFINSYDGISINSPADSNGSGEIANIENVYGTFLHSGISGFVQTDVGFWSNINISPSYYANALSKYRCNDANKLTRYTKDNLVGVTLGDLDDYLLSKINIEYANIGIKFSKDTIRIYQAFWGMLYEVNLINCITGIYAEKLYNAAGAVFSHSNLGTIVNVSEYGMIKLAFCSYDLILGNGNTIIEDGVVSDSTMPNYDVSHTFNIPNNLYYIDDLDSTGTLDSSVALNSILNALNDGGVVVLKNGVYRMDNTIVVPDNVMLTSFGNSFARSQAHEDLNFLVRFVFYQTSGNCIELGDYSGINGIRIACPKFNIPDAISSLNRNEHDPSYGVKAIGNYCFALNMEMAYLFNGFDFSNSEGHYVKYCFGCCYSTFIKAGTSGKIINCLTNLSFLSRSSLASVAKSYVDELQGYWFFERFPDKLETVRELTRNHSTMIEIILSQSELVVNCFSYAVKMLIDTNNSTVLAINTSLDYLKDNKCCYSILNGDVTIINTLRVFGKSFVRYLGHLKMYGRMDFRNKRELHYDSNINTQDLNEELPNSLNVYTLTNCEGNKNLFRASRYSGVKHSKFYSWKANDKINPEIIFTFGNFNMSSLMDSGYIRFYLYCSDITKKGDVSYFEFTSSGMCDYEEITFDIISQIQVTGWNEIIVKIATDKQSGSLDSFDPTKCNYFRFFALNANCTYCIDDIEFLYETPTSNTIVLSNCEDTTNAEGVSLSNNSSFDSHSWSSLGTTNKEFVLHFNPRNISSYSSGSVSFDFYCADLSMIGDVVVVELTSSGVCDNQEIYCEIKNIIAREGWNKIVIPFSMFQSGSTTNFNYTHCNYFRLFTLNSHTNLNIDNIRICSN